MRQLMSDVMYLYMGSMLVALDQVRRGPLWVAR
jgi:hypothetical protein